MVKFLLLFCVMQLQQKFKWSRQFVIFISLANLKLQDYPAMFYECTRQSNIYSATLAYNFKQCALSNKKLLTASFMVKTIIC